MTENATSCSGIGDIPEDLARFLALIICSVASVFLVAVLIEVPYDEGRYRTEFAKTFIDWFHPNREGGGSAWVGSMFLAGCGFGLIITGGLIRSSGQEHWQSWITLAGVLFFASLDESLEIHENFGWAVVSALKLESSSFNHFLCWAITYIVVLGSIALNNLNAIRKLPRVTIQGAILAATIFLVGAVGLDLLQSIWQDYQGSDGYVMNIMVLIEETMELAGCGIFIHTVASHLVNHVLPSAWQPGT